MIHTAADRTRVELSRLAARAVELDVPEHVIAEIAEDRNHGSIGPRTLIFAIWEQAQGKPEPPETPGRAFVRDLQRYLRDA
jgi:hypothetical protein